METMTIKDAAKKLQVEAHVLRYWEDELRLEIKRNAQGHRYYDERDIRMFEQVKLMKEEGLMLKDIREAIERAKQAAGQSHEKSETGRQVRTYEQKETRGEEQSHEQPEVRPLTSCYDEDSMIGRMEKVVIENEKVVDFKQAQLQSVMNRVIANALRENKDIITTSIKQEITADVMRQFDTVMREKEEREEARYRRLDEVLREIQHANAEVAATKSRKRFKRKH